MSDVSQFAFVSATKETLESNASASPFGDDYVLSLGYLFVLLISLPMGMYNLDDNIVVQKGRSRFVPLFYPC